MLSVILLAAGLGLLAVPACLVPICLGIRGWALPVSALVCAAATIVLAVELLSLAHALRSGWMLAVQAVAAVAALAIWLVRGRPRPALPPRPGPGRIVALARSHPLSALTAVLALIALAVQAVMAVAVVPNNWDSMTYHLARIGYWLQYDSALHFVQGTERQLSSAPNGEFLQMWPLLLGVTDRAAALAQWIAATGLWVTIALGARILGFSRAAALFAGALFVLLPQPLMQMTTTQNDLIVAFFSSASALFAVRGIRDRHLGELTVAALALGLAVGTKGTAFLFVPPLGLIVTGAILRWRPSLRLAVHGAAVAAGALIALASFNYILNQDTYGTPLGGLDASVKRESPLLDNGVRTAWSFADSPGVKVQWLENVTVGRGTALFGDLKTPAFPGFTVDSGVSEDTSGYGLFGWLVLLPLLVVVLVWLRSHRDRRLLAAAALLYMVLFAVLNEQNPWIARVLMPGIALGAPLLALLHRRALLGGASVALVLIGALPAILANQQKELTPAPGTPTALSRDETSQLATIRPDMDEPIRRLSRTLPSGARIGLVRDADSWDYAFMGRGRIWRVEPMPTAEATQATMRRRELDAIVFANVGIPRRLGVQRIGADYWLLRRNAR